MIKTLKVQNFQRHENLQFDLHPGLNVFVGKSGAGKSAGVSRPLRLLTLNLPLGDSYLYDPDVTGNEDWKEGPTKVEVVQDDGNTISRVKSKNDNYYELNGTKYRAFGRTPPEDIQKALNLSTLNFQFQHDGLFLLDMKETELAKLLNDLAGLDLIDSVTSSINKRLWAERAELNKQKALKEKLMADVEQYKELDRLENSCMVMEQLETKVRDKQIEYKKLFTLAARLRETGEELAQYEQLNTLIERFEELQTKAAELYEKLQLVNDMRRLSKRLSHTSTQLRGFEQLESAISWVETAIERSAEASEAKNLAKEMQELLYVWNSKASLVEDLSGQISDKETQFHELMPESCPLCGHEQVKD